MSGRVHAVGTVTCIHLAEEWEDDDAVPEIFGVGMWRVVVLIEANLAGASMERAQLRGANLFKAQLQGANLYAVQLQGADLY